MHWLASPYDPVRRAQGSTWMVGCVSHRLTGSHLTEHQLLVCSVFDALRHASTTMCRKSDPGKQLRRSSIRDRSRVVDTRVSLSTCCPRGRRKSDPLSGEEGDNRPVPSRSTLWNDPTTASREPRGDALVQGLRKYSAMTTRGQERSRSNSRRAGDFRSRLSLRSGTRKYSASTITSQVRS